MSREVPSPTDTLMFSIKIRMDIITQLQTSLLRVPEEDLLLLTPIFLNLRYLDMSLVFLKLIQTLSSSGRHSSEILPMEHRLSLINSSVRESKNGMLRMDLLCCYHTDTMELAQSIPRAESRDTSNSAIKMMLSHSMELTMTTKTFSKCPTCKLLTARPLPTTSTY